MGQFKKDVTPLLMHWSYIFLALTRRFYVSLQENADIVKSMRAIVSLASSHPSDLERLLSERLDLTQHKCYKAAVTQYDTFCWDISKVSWEAKKTSYRWVSARKT